MSNIKIGDTVLCINDAPLDRSNHSSPPLVYKKEYRVLDMLSLSCGCTSIDVGIKNDNNNHASCFLHHNKYLGKAIWWCSITRFVKSEVSENVNKETNIEIKLTTKELPVILAN